MRNKKLANLSRRERQIMDVLFSRGESSAQQIREQIPDAPSYSSVRALISRLVEKGVVTYRSQGNKHIYASAIQESHAQQSALSRLVNTFFKGSKINVVNALLDEDNDGLTKTDIERLERKLAL